MLTESLVALLATSISCNPAMTSEEISLSLVIIGAVAMISGALIIRHTLNRMTQNNEELSRGWRRITKKGGIIYINPVGAPRNYPEKRSDRSKQ